jgi:hypothetical protein
MDPSYIFQSTGTAWSEYGPLFENPESFSDQYSDIALFHYRCILKPLRWLPGRCPFVVRSILLKVVPFTLRLNGNNVYVGKRFELNDSVWNHFVTPYPQFKQIMIAGALEFDRLTSIPVGTSEEMLKSTNLLYPRNIFFGHQSFANEWLEISFKIAKHLDTVFPEPKEDRWGGYVLERLFSVYLQQQQLSGKIRIIEKDLLYFANDWFKVDFRSRYLNLKHAIKIGLQKMSYLFRNL